MKIFLLSLLVAAAFAAPAPLDDETGEPVELLVNGVAEGEPLELGDVLGIKVKQHVDGMIISSADLLHPLTAAGILEIAGGNNPTPVDVVENPEIAEVDPDSVEVVEVPENAEVEPDSVEVVEVPENVEIVPEPVELPPPVIPEVVPMPPVNEPAEIPDHIEIPVVPENPGSDPDVILPEINPPVGPIEPIPDPVPERPVGEVFNNGLVQVKVHGEPGVLATMQSWFNMVLNYFNGNDVASQQIV